MHKQLSMYCNGSNLDSTYSNSYNTMLTNWTCNSNGYVAASNSSFSSSKVDFYKHSSWPSEWGDAAACTRHFDKYGNCFQSFGVFDSTLKVAYVSIYTNPAKNSIVSQRNLAALILGHELGHAACLGHPNLPAPASIMTQGQEIWSKPQAHDRSDLASMYQ